MAKLAQIAEKPSVPFNQRVTYEAFILTLVQEAQKLEVSFEFFDDSVKFTFDGDSETVNRVMFEKGNYWDNYLPDPFLYASVAKERAQQLNDILIKICETFTREELEMIDEYFSDGGSFTNERRF